MRFFKNSDITKLYGVSDKAVRNWIASAGEGKIDLELHSEKDKLFIADTLHNASVIRTLVERGKKYQNKRSHRKIEPKPIFYELFNHKEISQILSHLETYHEYPQQYLFRGDGALHWAAYIDKLHTIGSDNYLAYIVELLRANRQFLEEIIERYKYVNVVDLGVGNGMAAYELLKIVLNTGKLQKYIGVDISPELLDIAESNLHEHFGDILIEKHIRDLNYDTFGDIITSDSYGDDSALTLNIVLFLGGTLVNFKDPKTPLQNIRDSLDKHSILLSSLKLDTPKSRRFFDFNPEKPSKSILSPHFKSALDFLGIDESLYDIEQYFDEEIKSRFTKIKLKFALTINFKMNTYSKLLTFQKGDNILIWRAWHFSDIDAISLWADNKFLLLNSLSRNDEYLFLAHKTKIPNSHLIN